MYHIRFNLARARLHKHREDALFKFIVEQSFKIVIILNTWLV